MKPPLPQETQPTPEQILASAKEFLDRFGVEIDPKTDRKTFLDALQQLDPRFKGNRDLVRWQLEEDHTEWADEPKKTEQSDKPKKPTEEVIKDTAEAMGLLKPETQLVGNFYVVVSLGAARQANLDRARYATEAIRNGHAKVPLLIITGSDRQLNEAEQDNVANYAPGAATEFDLATGAAQSIINEYPEISPMLVHVLGERANTTDVIKTVLAELEAGGVSPNGLKLGAVTTQIYQPFTSIEVAAAAKELGVAETFVAGNPSDPNIVAKRTPATYLSEILRTLRAAANNIE
jgi:hypothetical protein